jgi:prophage regulatory protein
MADNELSRLSILRRRDVERRVGLSRSPLYARIKAGTFPRPVRLGGGHAVGWLAHEVDNWLAQQIAVRESQT